MKLLLAFLPFLCFAVLSSLDHSHLGLCLATVLAGALFAHAAMGPAPRRLILDGGSFVLFGAVTAFVLLSGETLAVGLVRAIVDGGLMLVILATVLAGRPFTLDYSPDRGAATPDRRRAHQVISLAWAAALAFVVVIDLALWRGALTARQATFAIVGTGFAAYRFSRWYATRGIARGAR